MSARGIGGHGRSMHLIAVLMTAAAACTPHPRAPVRSSLDGVRAAGVLRWGADQQGGEPYVFEDPKRPGTMIGFEVEIADALARSLGVRAELVQNDWPTLIPSLERGTFDIALNGIEVTPALKDRVAFSRPYFVFTERLVARDDDARVTDLASLTGLRVGTLAATQAWHMLLAAGAIAVPYEGVEEPFIDLENRRTDAVLLDDIIVDRYVPRHQTLRVVGDLAEGRYAVALRKQEPELRAAMDTALESLIASGDLHRILDRWHIDGPWQARLGLPVDSYGDGVSDGHGDRDGNRDGRGDSKTARTDSARAGASSLAASPRFGFRHFVWFLQGALVTLVVSSAGMVIAVSLGLALALARLYASRALVRWLASAYIELFRGTPVLLQLYVLYYGLAPVLRIDALGAAILGLGLNYAAYEAEIYRAGISAIPAGQLEAALSLGMTRAMALRRVVLPQALRVALPGVTNDFIALLKDSSLVSVITVVELTKRMSITAVDTRGWLVPGLACAALYFAMSYPLSRLARRLERRLAGP
jgi:polar amino acid transport system substrate-binding protein